MKNYFAHTKQENLESYRKELSQQPYYNMMRGFYIFAWIVIFACQAVSAYSEYVYFTGFFSHLLTGVWLHVASVAIASVIEGFKFFLFSILFSQLYNVHGRAYLNPLALVFCLAVSSISITTSIIGGGTLGIDTAKVTSTETKHDSEISALRNEIKEIQKRNTWRGNTYIQGKDKTLLHQKESELSKAKTSKESELNQVAAQNKEQENSYRYGFASFEICYILLTLFTYYYKKRSYIEDGQASTTTSNEARPQTFTHIPSQQGVRQRYVQNLTNYAVRKDNNAVRKRKDTSTIEEDTPTNKIGFDLNAVRKEQKNVARKEVEKIVVEVPMEGKRKCKNCGNLFVYSDKKHWHCADKCRIEAWEKENKRKVYFKTKNQQSLF
jgi:hypothetical protein